MRRALYIALVGLGLIMSTAVIAVWTMRASLVRRAVLDALASEFSGQISVDVEYVDLGRAHLRGLKVTAPSGEQVLHLDSVTVAWDLATLLSSLSSGSATVVSLPEVNVAGGTLVLGEGLEGKALRAALSPRPSEPSTGPGKPSRPVTVSIGHLSMTGLVVSGTAGTRTIQTTASAELRELYIAGKQIRAELVASSMVDSTVIPGGITVSASGRTAFNASTQELEATLTTSVVASQWGTAQMQASGNFDRVDLSLKIESPHGALNVNGTVSPRAQTSNLEVSGQVPIPAEFLSMSPWSSPVQFSGTAKPSWGSAPHAHVELQLASAGTPFATVFGYVDPADALVLARLDRPARTAIMLHQPLSEPLLAGPLSGFLHTSGLDLSTVTHGTVRGTATLQAHATDLLGEGRTIHAVTTATDLAGPGGSRLYAPRLEATYQDAHVAGSVISEGLEAGPASCGPIRASIAGDLEQATLQGACGDTNLGGAVSITSKVLSGLSLQGPNLDLTLATLSWASPPRIVGLRLSKPFPLSLDATVRNLDVEGKLSVHDFPISWLGELTGVPLPSGARASIDATVDAQGKGSVVFGVDGVTVGVVDALTLRASFARDGQKFLGRVLIRKAIAAEGCSGEQVEFTPIEFSLAGPLLSAESWRNAQGTALLDAPEIDIGCLASVLPLEPMGIRASGKAYLSAFVERSAKAPFPTAAVGLKTLGLKASGPGWDTGATDIEAIVELLSHNRTAKASVRLFEEVTLAEGNVTLALAGGLAYDIQAIKRLPWLLHVTVPEFDLGRVAFAPSPVRDALSGFSGRASLDLYADGTPDKPFGVARGAVADFLVSRGERGALFPATNAQVLATLRDGNVDAQAWATLGGAGRLQLTGQASAADLLNASGPSGRLEIAAENINIAELPLADQRQVSGHVTGRVAVDTRKGRRMLFADLASPDITLEGQRMTLAALNAFVPPPRETLPASASLSLTALPGQTLALQLVSEVSPDDTLGAIGGSGDALVSLQARHFPLAPLAVVLPDEIQQLDGWVDGTASLQPGAQGNEWSADLRLTQVRVDIPDVGQELRNGKAHVLADRASRIQISNLEAQALSGRVTGSGSLTFQGLSLHGIEASLHIADTEKVPLTVEGVPLGQVSGTLGLFLEPTDTMIEISIGVQDGALLLPTDPGRNVQGLDPIHKATFSHPVESPRPQRVGAPVALNLASQSLWVSGEQLRVRLSTQHERQVESVRMVFDGKPTAHGRAHIEEGQFIAFGKRFVFDAGDITLNGPLSDPKLQFSSHWDASPSLRVILDYAGPLSPISESGLRFRSEPEMDSREVLAVLFSGTILETSFRSPRSTLAGGRASTADSSADFTTASVGGAVIAQQLNTVLSGLEGVRANLTASEDGSPRASLSLQATDSLSATVAYEGGDAEASSASASRLSKTTAGRTELQLEWQFAPMWSLTPFFGLSGTDPHRIGLDLLWRYRY